MFSNEPFVSHWEFTKVDSTQTRTPLGAQVARLLNEQMQRCSVQGEENTVVRIGRDTYVDVSPRIHSPNILGWTMGDNNNPGHFFEVERMLNTNAAVSNMMNSLSEPTSVWNVTCVPDNNHYHTEDSAQTYKVLRILDINGYPIDRVMTHWLPIVHSLGRSSRGSTWRVPVLYMNMRRRRNEQALGAHVPLSSQMLNHSSLRNVFNKNSRRMPTLNCIFDMSSLHIETTNNGYEYLVASGTTTNSNGTGMAVPIVLGVFNPRDEDSV